MSLANADTKAPDRPPPPELGREIHYPTSLAQQRFWVLDRLDPGNPALNVAVRWRLEGELSASLIEKAFELIVSRHESLRTFLVEDNGEPIQTVRKSPMPLRVPSIDLTVLPEAEAIAECDRIAQAEARTRFNVTFGPLIRVTHVRVRGDLAMLLVTSHHTVCDGWSIGILAHEMGEICEAMQAGRPPMLPELPITYGDFARWQRAFIAGGGLAKDMQYWSRTLSGTEFFAVPGDFPQPPTALSTGAIRSRLLDRGLTDTLAAMARQHGCTLFMLTLAALLTLLHRYTGATDIAIGTQVAGRDQLETENVVGLFINTLVLRNDLSGDPSFSALLASVRDGVGDALDHGTMPLEKIIETLRPKRHPGQNVIFSVNFIFQRSFVKNIDHGKFRLVDTPSYSAGAMYDLNFFMVERPEGWRASCEFNSSIYDERTIDQLLRHFGNILAAVPAAPSMRLSTIPILDDIDRTGLLDAGIGSAGDYPRHLSLPQLIARQAARTPGATAVVDADQAYTYQDVERRSSAMAAMLAARGIGPGTRVGVFVERTVDLVVVPLAIMKAGAAYVPLDPVYPGGRLAQIIGQSRLSAIVARSSAALSAVSADVPIVEIDDAAADDDVMLPTIQPSDTAYVIFTSGSTGRPKGVQIPHRALTNFLWSMRREPGFTSRDTVLAVTTICFDIAVLELFLPLTLGAKVFIATSEEVRDGRLLLALLRRSRAKVLQATPTTWQMLMEAGWQGDPELRMLCGGEPLPRQLAERLLARCPELWNMYGPTETTIWSSVKRVTANDPSITLGTPIANTQFYVVDQCDELVPQGAAGELLIGGDGVAIGYWEMPEATSERFVPDKFSGLPGARLYRTGDIVRMKRDGEYQFLGRADHQVKIRGFRIELGEIESALLEHPDIRHAVAVVGQDASRSAAIFAYVELARGSQQPQDQLLMDLRARLTQALPGYMRPAAITVLDAIPRLPNGKVDRKALPPPVLPTATAASDLEELNEIERRLKEIWCSILGLETIDGSADFFDLGGHSLLAAKLLARVDAVFGRQISLSALFAASNFRSFAKLLHSSDQRDFDFRQVVRLQPRSTKRGVIAINNTGIYLTLSRHLGGKLPVTALQLFDPSFPRGPLPTTVEEIAAQYIDLIRHLQPSGPYVFLGWCNGGVLAYEIARQLHLAGHHVARVIVIDTWVPGYLKNQTWWRSKLADISYRSKLIAADWADMRAGKKTFRRFLADRVIVNSMVRRLKRPPEMPDSEFVAAENYDRWLVTYLDQLLEVYEPTPFDCRMTVFRSSREPAGRFLDKTLGWRSFATGGVDLVTVPGDHFSVFKHPGISVIARHIEMSVALELGETDPGDPGVDPHGI
jgi:amino acid adenylation domain-containing protein